MAHVWSAGGTAMWGWLVFAVLVIGLLALDLVVFHRVAARESLRSAAWWSAVWIGLGLAFGGFILATRGVEPALAYLTGFLIGAKMLLAGVVEVPTAWSLLAVAAILAGATVLSFVFPDDPSPPSS